MRPPTIAVVGCGQWGRNLVRVFRELGVLAMACDRSEDGRQRATLCAPGVAVTGDLDLVLQSDVTAVVLATPAETHTGLAGRVLDAGKDVFVEKPLALTWRDGQALVSKAERHGLVLMVGHVLEYHPALRRLQGIVASEEFGTLQYLYSHRLSLGKVRREENILWSFAPHDLAVILRVVGMMPVEVVTCGGSYLQPAIADVTVTHLTFQNGVRAHIHVSWLHPFKEQRLVVIGSRGMVSFDDQSNKLLRYELDADLSKGLSSAPDTHPQDVPFANVEPLRMECEAFVAAVTSRRPPLTDGPSALRVLQVLEVAQRSLGMRGAPVRLTDEVGQR